MQKASKRLIIFYKSKVVEPIQMKLIKDGALVSMEEVDTLLKSYADYDFTSTKEMTTEQLAELIEWSFQFAKTIGLELDYPKDDLDNDINLNFDR